jgi:hypothetical protein
VQQPEGIKQLAIQHASVQGPRDKRIVDVSESSRIESGKVAGVSLKLAFQKL